LSTEQDEEQATPRAHSRADSGSKKDGAQIVFNCDERRDGEAMDGAGRFILVGFALAVPGLGALTRFCFLDFARVARITRRDSRCRQPELNGPILLASDGCLKKGENSVQCGMPLQLLNKVPTILFRVGLVIPQRDILAGFRPGKNIGTPKELATWGK
jgi:hypothetical protein